MEQKRSVAICQAVQIARPVIKLGPNLPRGAAGQSYGELQDRGVCLIRTNGNADSACAAIGVSS